MCVGPKHSTMDLNDSVCEEGPEMEIPMNASVRLADGPFGRATHVIVDLHTQQVTHLVVNAGERPALSAWYRPG